MAVRRRAAGQAARQPIDRHDPPGVQDLAVTGQHLELRVVDGQLAPEVLDLPGHDDLAADRQPALDEPTAEPGGIDAARVVFEAGDRALDATPEARLHPDVTDRGLDRHDRPVLLHVQVADDPHLAQVVVASRQVEQQVADRVEVQPDAGAAKLLRGREPGLAQRRRPAARRGRSAAAAWPGPASSRSRAVPSAALLRRDQVPVEGLAAVPDLDLGAPASRRRSCAPSPRPRRGRRRRRRTS